MQIDVRDLALHLMRAEHPAPAHQPLYSACYELWREVWATTFQELDGVAEVKSDGFCRQTRMIAITYRRQPVALTMQHDLDFRLPTARADSYFDIWPEAAIDKLLRDGPKVTVTSNTTVHPDYRGDLGAGVKLKNIVMGMQAKCVIHGTSDVGMGIARCQRGIHLTAHRYGAEAIHSGIKMHNEAVELLGFFRRRMLEPGVVAQDALVDLLWSERVEHDAPLPSLSETDPAAPVVELNPYRRKVA